MDKITKLSEAIRLGSTHIAEGDLFSCSSYAIQIGRSACAVGTAYRATFTEPCEDGGPVVCELLAQRFNVPLTVVCAVSTHHYAKRMTRAQCADWLEAQGY